MICSCCGHFMEPREIAAYRYRCEDCFSLGQQYLHRPTFIPEAQRAGRIPWGGEIYYRGMAHPDQ